jgi:superfamily II DNA or RNA helicase
MRLEDIHPGSALTGLDPADICTVAAVVPVAEGCITVFYRTPDGTTRERLLTRADEASLSPATSARPWSFDGHAADFQLAVEARRIDLAFLFDPMMAVHTSNVDPLPHQITAVYESMLPLQPLRFVLADDPGSGKTIMAGLYIRELLMRADARRILIVAPGSLVEQWREELFEKFGLEFRVHSRELEASSPSGNAFETHDQLIVRLDQLSRNEDAQEKAAAVAWDLVVFDEAHKLSAHFSGQEMKRTARFRFAEKIGKHTRHLLLMTATPHNGKEEDFQLFLSLLDSDRFYGRFRDGVHRVDSTDIMRRMVKEEMVRFDGTRLFPTRRAYTVNYRLSELESALYEAVTQYVKTEMGKADELAGTRKLSVGFALTALQRRLASSPEAIFQSLKRRRERLERRLREEQMSSRGRTLLVETLLPIPEDDDDLPAAEQEAAEEALVDQASAAATVAELQAEIISLTDLERRAREVVSSGRDRKWEELSRILQNDPAMRDATGRQRKLIVFSEHRDTLNYLQKRIGDVLGNPDAVVAIHGGTHRDERRRIQGLFRSDPDVRVLVATDAAGEGVNLQNANLMVNYDLPWNPNRLEQRFGRIHRIGQSEVCHLWNLVARETREGEVFHRLLHKLSVEGDALQGRVFDILGEVFEEVSLRDLLIEAIRSSNLPEVQAGPSQRIEEAFDPERIRALVERNALAQESMSPERLFAVKEELDKAEARRLQPLFVRAYFLRAFDALGGTIHPRETGRFEITHVPEAIRERDRRITGRNRRDLAPVLRRYERVCFTRDAARPADRPGAVHAPMLHPGHPLVLAVTDLLLERHANLLRQGALLIDPTDTGETPSLLFLLTHEVRSGDHQTISKRLQFVRVNPDHSAAFAGWAPHLDLLPPDPTDEPLLAPLRQSSFLQDDLERIAVTYASAQLAPAHYTEVAQRRIAQVDRTLAAVHERLTREIAFWTDRFIRLSDDLAAGADVRLPREQVRRTLHDLEQRLESRRRELQSMRHVVSTTPVVLSGALVIPAGLLQKLRNATAGAPNPQAFAGFSADAAARARIEQIAMEMVRRAEEARGCRVTDVSAEKCGWDLTSHEPLTGSLQPVVRHIEVKGRSRDATTLTVTSNEVRYAINQADKFLLAIVLVDEAGQPEGPFYLRNPFDTEPGWGVASLNYDLAALLARATR